MIRPPGNQTQALDELRKFVQVFDPQIVADYDVVPGPYPEDAAHVLHVFNVPQELSSKILRATARNRSELRRIYGVHVNVVCHSIRDTKEHYAAICDANSPR